MKNQGCMQLEVRSAALWQAAAPQVQVTVFIPAPLPELQERARNVFQLFKRTMRWGFGRCP